MNRPELLAPAGDYSCFQAAIRAGADAVYLGGQQYGARAFAGNFTQEELLRALEEAHFYGKKIYLTVNTLMKQEELDSLEAFIAPFYEAGLDGVIVQDVGALSVLKSAFPNLPLHASTQMTITNADGALALKELGIVRVVPARELTLEEIRKLKRESGMEIETFIHGAMCYCYSGQCLFSSFLGGRSGNRGRCAQPCRQPYKIAGEKQGKECYPLSLKDMFTLHFIPDLMDAGIDSFKIEGRMKKPEYVAGVTDAYRRRIDEYLRNPGQKKPVREADIRLLSALYIRSSVSGGYYDRHNGKEMVTLDQPGYAGSDEAVLTRIRTELIEREKTLPVQMFASLFKGSPMGLTAYVTREDGSLYPPVSLEGGLVQAAQKRPLVREEVEKQLGKVGGSGFYVEALQVEMEDDIFLPVKELNELRRNVLETLKKQIAAENMPYEPVRGGTVSDFVPEVSKIVSLNSEKTNRSISHTLPRQQAEVHVSVSTREQLHACIGQPISRIYLPYSIGAEAAKLRTRTDAELFLTFPAIMRDEKRSGQKESPMAVYENLLDQNLFDGVQIASPSALTWLKRYGWNGPIAFDHRMYVWNRETYRFWNEKMNTYCAPLELNRHDLFRLPYEKKEMLVYGRIPMMVTANCIRRTTGTCLLEASAKNVRSLGLIDRYQTEFPVMTDCRFCYNIIYNSVPLSLHGYLDEISRNAESIRMDFIDETAGDTAERIRMFVQMLEACSGIREGSKKTGAEVSYDFTTGHYKKGAL